jgi:hypothetical protein
MFFDVARDWVCGPVFAGVGGFERVHLEQNCVRLVVDHSRRHVHQCGDVFHVEPLVRGHRGFRLEHHERQ